MKSCNKQRKIPHPPLVHAKFYTMTPKLVPSVISRQDKGILTEKQPIGDVKLYNMPKLAPILPISSSQQNPSWWKLGEMFLDASRHENLSMIANSCLGKVGFNFLATCKSENRWREHFSSPPLLQKKFNFAALKFFSYFLFCANSQLPFLCGGPDVIILCSITAGWMLLTTSLLWMNFPFSSCICKKLQK